MATHRNSAGIEPRSVTRAAELPQTHRMASGNRLLVFLITLLGIGVSCRLYSNFANVSEHLWYSSLHDRNAHLSTAMNLAIDFRTLDVPGFFKDIHGARIWGPLHPLVTGFLMALGGLDGNVAVLPSLIAWIGCGVFAFLIVRLAVPSGGNLAGLIAALFIFSSPAYRAFATDVMLESPGSCLSLGAIYFWMRLNQKGGPNSAAGLGLMLSLLFFTKYNYWLLVLLPMTLVAFSQRFFELTSHVLVTFGEINWKKELPVQVKHPLNWLLGLMVTLLVWCKIARGDLHLGPWHLEIKTNQNMLSVFAFVAFARVYPWWWRTGIGLVSRQGSPVRQLIYWHCWPVILWFLWPQKLGNCLAYLTRDHGAGEDIPAGFLGGLPYYWGCLGNHYHSINWFPWLIVGLIAVALLSFPKLKNGSGFLFVFFLFASVMTLHHPTLRSRFLHSWLGIIWILAGIGISRILVHPIIRSRIFARAIALGGAMALVVVLGTYSFSGIGHSPEGGPRPGSATISRLMRIDAPYIHPDQTTVVLSNLPIKFLANWTYLQGGGQPRHLLTDLPGLIFASIDPEQQFEHWMASQQPATIVYVHIPRQSVFCESFAWTEYGSVRYWLSKLSDYQIQYHHRFGEYGDASVTVWTKSDASPGIKAQITAR